MEMDIRQVKHCIYDLPQMGDGRGELVVLSKGQELPFNVKRIFYNYNTQDNVIRGNHANLKSSFLMISVKGCCSVEVDDGAVKYDYLLDSPDKALFIGKGIWKIMKNFSDDNVLLILSDCLYNEKEYIRNYEDYLKITSRK